MTRDGTRPVGRFIADPNRLERIQKRTYRIRLTTGEQLCLRGKFSVSVDRAHSHDQAQFLFNGARTSFELWSEFVPVDALPWQSAPVWQVQTEYVQLRVKDRSSRAYPWPLKLSCTPIDRETEAAQPSRSRFVVPPLEYEPTKLERILEALQTETAPVVLVCGPRKAGKSTLISLLSFLGWPRFGAPLVMELDVGQNLFLAPGYVSLHALRALAWPVWKAPTERIESFFCGFVTPLSEPQLYAVCVEHLWQVGAQYRGRRLILVNTLGWTQGYGRSLLQTLIEMIQPNLIVRIDETMPSIGTEPSLWTKEASLTTVGNTCTVFHLESAPESSRVRRSLSPAHMRASQILHELLQQCDLERSYGTLADYFRWLVWMNSPAFPVVQQLCSVPPWCVALDTFSAVFVTDANGMRCLRPETDRAFLYRILNASIVALCVAQEELEDSTPRRRLLRSPGLGLVRSIDIDKGLLYMITSLPGSVLEQTTALATSPDVQLPAAALQLGGMQAEPYLGLACTGGVEEPASDRTAESRKNLLRRRLRSASTLDA